MAQVQLNGFGYAFLPYQSFDDGALLLGVVCKRTYRLVPGERSTPDPSQLPLFAADVHWDRSQPLVSSIKHETDHVPCKPKTDFVVNARAYAPGGAPVDRMTVSAEVEGVAKKEILVLGDRTCVHRPGLDPTFTEPRAFTEMPIRYEYAYGGIDSEGAEAGGVPFLKNDVGVGFALAAKGASESVDGMPLPNLEDPQDRLTPARILVPWDQVRATPTPAGFGWYGRGWVPRIDKAGIPRAHRDVWEKTHDLPALMARGAPIKDFDLEFFNGASPGLVLPILRGDEWIRLGGLDPAGACRFQLPAEAPHVALDVGAGLQTVTMRLTTVAVLREDDRLYLCWSGALRYASNDELFSAGFQEIVMEPVAVPPRDPSGAKVAT